MVDVEGVEVDGSDVVEVWRWPEAVTHYQDCQQYG
jgi:TPP-dependent pyruvate/acetoin dehydrogenase alpha subunit